MLMRHLLIVVWGLLLLGGVSGPTIAEDATSDERILSFTSYIQVQPDASLTVTETIAVRATGDQIKRGIVRDFPTVYKDRFGNWVKVGFEVLEVRCGATTEPYQVKSAANGKKVYIGHQDVSLPPGIYTYTLKYRTTWQLGFFKDFDELYWNVTGNGWTFAIDRAEAVVILPDGANILQKAAYTGPLGAKGQDFWVSYDRAGNIVFTTTVGLAPQEGLTIAVAWPKGLVPEPSDAEKRARFLKDNPGLFLGSIWLIILLGYYLVVWNRVGRNPEEGAIIPLLEPPKGFSPAAARFLMRMGFDNQAFTAALVNMAVKGYLTIEENDGDYSLRRRSGNNADLSPGERRLGGCLFVFRDVVEMKNDHRNRVKTARDALKDTLNKELTKIYFDTNSTYLIPGIILTVIALGSIILSAPFKGESGFSSLWLSIWSVGCYGLGLKVYRSWQGFGDSWLKALKTLGFTLLSLPVFAGLIVGTLFFGQTVSYSAAFILISIGLLNAVFFHLLKAPTLKGRQVIDQLEGFKMYLSVAEKERLEILHPPERTPELFEKYLPYALALDVENEWSDQFAEVLAQAQSGGQPYSPAWYQGRAWGDFQADRFVNTLGGDFAGAISSSSSPPGSSSGSGGGGSSGGGGGGGGGSGW